MEFKELTQDQHRRKAASTGVLIVFIAIVCSLLERMAGWSWYDIGQSLGTFVIVLLVSCLRFRTRTKLEERLWITWLWDRLLSRVEVLLEKVEALQNRKSASPERADDATAIGRI